MTETPLGIYNAAIVAAEGKGRLSSLTQNSKEREACDTWYQLVLQTVQEAAYFPSSKVAKRLTLETERTTSAAWTSGDPHNPYLYKYGLPNDYLRAWHLMDYSPFELLYDEDTGAVKLNTNSPSAILVYARKNELPAQWTPAQRQATIYGLAAHIVPDISKRSSVRDRNIQLANDLLMQAQATSANSDGFMQEAVPPDLLARGVIAALPVKYYYPHGSLFTGGSGNA